MEIVVGAEQIRRSPVRFCEGAFLTAVVYLWSLERKQIICANTLRGDI